MRYILTLLILLSASPAQAALTEDDLWNIKRAEQYLNQIDTLSSEFVQLSPYKAGGTVSYGNLYISRPGKARWEYTTPNKLLMVIKDGKLAYHDKDLDQISYAKLESELSNLLLHKDIKLNSSPLRVVDVHRDQDGFKILVEQDVKLEDKEDSYLEQLALVFQEGPLRLIRFQFKDISNQITTVELRNPVIGKPLDKELFIFKNPRLFDRKP